jgi:tRNA A58 N-methylase Trm61
MTSRPAADAVPDAELSNQRYAKHAKTFDKKNAFIFERIRAQAARSLNLKPGGHVIEAGSGTGANLPYLVKAVGPNGQVTGVEMSPDMAAKAKERIAKHGWKNVEIRLGPAATTEVPQGLDGALFFMTHDIIRTPAALDNILGALRPGARVASFGPKESAKWNVLVNLVTLSKAKVYHTTFESFDKPWTLLEPRLEDFKVRRKMFGGGYLATGRIPG